MTRQNDDDSLPMNEPHLLKFRLWQLLLWTALASVFCALVVTASGPWPLIIVVSSLAVAAHVLGNLIGTRLRDTSHQVQQWRAADPRQPADDPLMTPKPYDMRELSLPAKTNLAGFSHLVRGMKWYLLGGLLIGAAIGASILFATIGSRITVAGWTVAMISSGVLGIWLAFLVVSFTTIARDALRQAHSQK